jgi:hypothetical protein
VVVIKERAILMLKAGVMKKLTTTSIIMERKKALEEMVDTLTFSNRETRTMDLEVMKEKVLQLSGA